MYKGPEEESIHEGESFEDWRDFRRAGETPMFEYSDETEAHINDGKSQHFHYEPQDNPEKE